MKKHILLIITMMITAVIFINSSMSATQSTVESDSAFSMLETITEFLHIPNLFTEITIRKLAHFVEFSVLGFFLSATVHAYFGTFKNQLFKILFFLLAIPIADEFIQYFSEGRSSQISDAILDFGGCIFGFLCLALFLKITEAIKKRRKSKA